MKKQIEFNRFKKAYFAFRFLTDCAFIYPVYLILFKHRGLDVWQISTLLALWCVFTIVLEVPTGALADRWNRRYMLMVGMACKAVGFAIWAFAHNFWLFALGFFFWGVQETFCSGTQESILYENLQRLEKASVYETLAGRGHFYSRIGAAIAMLAGSVMASFDFGLVTALSAVVMAVGVIPVFFMRDVRHLDRDYEPLSYWQGLKSAARESVHNKTVLGLLIYSTIFIGIIGTLDEFDQLYYDWIQMPVAFFGVAMVARMLAEALGCRFTPVVRKYVKGFTGLLIIATSGMILIGLITWYPSIFWIPAIMAIFFGGAVAEVAVESDLQKSMQGTSRATVLSINSLMVNSSAMVFILIFGALSQSIHIAWGFRWLAGVILIYLILYRIKNFFTPNQKEE